MTASKLALDVLLVEDNPADALLAELTILDVVPHATVRAAGDVRGALEALEHLAPDVVLIDLDLPDVSGLDAVTTICRSVPQNPVIVLTGNVDPSLALSALEHGAQDYLIKGEYTPELLERSIRYARERKRSERALLDAARNDPVTGLVNRYWFTGQLDHALARAERSKQHVHLLFLDLDHFKHVNDTLGHAAGDRLLRGVAERLLGCVRASDTVARLGGDEFVVMIECDEGTSAAMRVADKVLHCMAPCFELDGVDVTVTPSIGIASAPSAGRDADTLLKHADTAMYRAKARGRNTVELFTEALDRAVREEFELEMALRQAVPERDFVLHYQPIVDCETGVITGTEALLRWRRPGHDGLVKPDLFLPQLEKSRLIVEVGAWVLERACAQAAQWRGGLAAPYRMSVNVSPRQLEQGDFVETVVGALDRTGLPPECLMLELTEQVLLERNAANGRQLEALRALGVGIAIDDFGSGYSSLAYLTAFPFDTVKLDRSFVQRVAGDPEHGLLAAGVIAIAEDLGRRVVVEGVENAEHVDFLRQHDCREAQGWHFSEALAPDAFEALTPVLLAQAGASRRAQAYAQALAS